MTASCHGLSLAQCFTCNSVSKTLVFRKRSVEIGLAATNRRKDLPPLPSLLSPARSLRHGDVLSHPEQLVLPLPVPLKVWPGMVKKFSTFPSKFPRKPNFSSSFRTHHYFELHVGCWGGFKDRVRDLEAARQAINFNERSSPGSEGGRGRGSTSSPSAPKPPRTRLHLSLPGNLNPFAEFGKKEAPRESSRLRTELVSQLDASLASSTRLSAAPTRGVTVIGGPGPRSCSR